MREFRHHLIFLIFTFSLKVVRSLFPHDFELIPDGKGPKTDGKRAIPYGNGLILDGKRPKTSGKGVIPSDFVLIPDGNRAFPSGKEPKTSGKSLLLFVIGPLSSVLRTKVDGLVEDRLTLLTELVGKQKRP